MHKFGVEFKYEGSTWSFHIFANNRFDAEQRLEEIKANGFIYGVIAEEQDAITGETTYLDEAVQPVLTKEKQNVQTWSEWQPSR